MVSTLCLSSKNQKFIYSLNFVEEDIQECLKEISKLQREITILGYEIKQLSMDPSGNQCLLLHRLRDIDSVSIRIIKTNKHLKILEGSLSELAEKNLEELEVGEDTRSEARKSFSFKRQLISSAFQLTREMLEKIVLICERLVSAMLLFRRFSK